MSDAKTSNASSGAQAISVSVWPKGEEKAAVSISLQSTDTVATLISKYEERSGENGQILIFPKKPKQPLAATATLLASGVTNGTVLYAFDEDSLEGYVIQVEAESALGEVSAMKAGSEQKKGGVEVSFPFADLKQMDRFRQADLIAVSKDTPKWQYVYNGFSLQGTCTNTACAAHNQILYVPLGFGEFDMGRTAFKAKCPACGNKCTANSPVFARCYWKFEGAQPNATGDDNTEYSCKWRYAPQFTFFNNDVTKGADAQAKWRFLTIWAKKERPTGDDAQFE